MCASGSFNITNPKGRIASLPEGESGDGNLCEKNLFRLPEDLDGTCAPIEEASSFCGCPSSIDYMMPTNAPTSTPTEQPSSAREIVTRTSLAIGGVLLVAL